MSADALANRNIPQIGIDVVEAGRSAREGRIAFALGRDFEFSTAGLQSYLYANWEPVMYDAMVIAAAIEFGDKIRKRPPTRWTRRISLRVPVHDPNRWSSPTVALALQDALEFLTGDYWDFEFVGLSKDVPYSKHSYLNFPVKAQAVLAYSDGMDSQAVAGIFCKSYGEKLVRVRIGPKGTAKKGNNAAQVPFATVPYKVFCNKRDKESGSRSRGFKFALISGIAAYIAGVNEIIIPESGQGVIGPALITVGQGYPDYRNHPLFTKRMSKFINALFGTQTRFVFPRIWNTKGETLKEFVSLSEGGDWESTRSCWRPNNWSSVNGKRRQCGVCAACMLRRVSVHTAGLMEKPDVYITTDMSAKTFDEAIDKEFTRRCEAFNEYAIGGILHMDHLAYMAEADASRIVKRHATLIASALDLSREHTERQLNTLLRRHAEEWRCYLNSLGAHSFVKKWVQA